MIRRVSVDYAAATQGADGRWTMGAATTETVADWGSLRIEVGAEWGTANPPNLVAAGTDITTINDIPTIIEGLAFGEPYGETTGSLSFPGIALFDDPSAVGVTPGANVDIYRVLPETEAEAAGVDEVGYWHGFIASLEVAEGEGIRNPVVAHLFGSMFGEASLRAHQPLMQPDSYDIGSMLNRALRPQDYGRPLPPYRFYFEATTTGIESTRKGSRGTSVMDHCDELLSIAQTSSTAWTIRRAYDVSDYPQPRKYYLNEKSPSWDDSVQSSTIHVGGYGVQVSLSRDMTQTPNSIYGEGLASSGERWRNARYPNLWPSETPAYPSRVSGTTYPVTSADADADFTADVVTQAQYQLRALGMPDVEITGVWDTNTITGINALWALLGETEDGVIASDGDWDLLFTTTTTDIKTGYFSPLYVLPEADPYTYYADGGVSGNRAAYDGRIRVERSVSFGDGISKSRATTYARRLVNQAETPAWFGSITLTADPVERSKLHVREGGWVRLVNVAGSTLDLYVAGVTITDEGGQVSLQVASEPWDLLDLTTRIQRDREANADPAKAFYALRTRPERPFRDAVGWDKESGAGTIRPTSINPGWNVIKMVGAVRGTILAADVKTYSSPTKFAMAVFGGSVSAANLRSWVANPLAEVAADGYGWWNQPSIQDDLTAHGFIEAWGEFGEAAGYWPGAESNGNVSAGTVTGRMVDYLGWSFESLDAPFIWLAVYNPGGTAMFRGDMRITIEE